MHHDDILRFIHEHGPDKASDSREHSGSPRIHFGLSNPTMRNYAKTWKKSNPDMTYNEWENTLTRLYDGASIDECCIAGMSLEVFTGFRQILPLIKLDEWIGKLRGWREIDTTCQSNYSAAELLLNWDEWDGMLGDMSIRSGITYKRASLVLLIKPLRDSDDVRFLRRALKNIESVKSKRDIIVTKAVSWILRAGLKHHRDAVAEYVDSNIRTLPKVAVREFQAKYQLINH